MYEEDFLKLIGGYDGFALDSTSDEEVVSLMKMCFYHGCIHALDSFWNDIAPRKWPWKDYLPLLLQKEKNNEKADGDHCFLHIS